MNISEPELFIDGRFRTASGVEPVIDATTEQLLGEGPSASIGDIDGAVAASRGALREWSAIPAVDRARFLERYADALAARAVDTSELCAHETGSPVTFSRIMNGLIPTEVFRYYAAVIRKTECEETRPSAPFGGVKSSGVGRELGPEGLAAYQTLKSIFRLGSPPDIT